MCYNGSSESMYSDYMHKYVCREGARCTVELDYSSYPRKGQLHDF